MPRLRSVDTLEYGFLLAAMFAAGAAQYPGAALAVHRVLDDVVVALGEPPPTPLRQPAPARVNSPYSADAPPSGKPAVLPSTPAPPASACPPGATSLGPLTPPQWWRPLLPEFDARALAGRLKANHESTTGKWR